MISFKRILCPIDFSEPSARALIYATALARWYDAQLEVLYVTPAFDPAADPSVRPAADGQVLAFASREEIIAEIRRAADRAGATDLDVRPLAQEGRAHELIVNRAAAQPADLLVMGTHGRSGFNRLLLGSVTEKVVHTAPCPVLTVPPAARDTPVVFRRILCPIDDSPGAATILRYALELGRQTDGCVTVLHVLEHLDPNGPDEQDDGDTERRGGREVERARTWMQGLLAGEERTCCDIEEVVAVNGVHEEILQRAAAAPADLIVMGAQGRSGLGLMVYGSNTQRVVRGATCPVLAVRL